MVEPEQWVWVWLVAVLVFAAGEMLSPGSFFLLPFAVGAAVTLALAILGAGLVLQWAGFLVLSVAALAATRPLVRRFDRSGDDAGIGSRRLIGQTAVVTDAIPAGGELGTARVHREEWRAESLDGSAIPEGAKVRVAEVQGTRVLVAPVERDTPCSSPPSGPPSTAP